MTSRRELKKLCEAGHVRKIWDTDLGICCSSGAGPDQQHDILGFISGRGNN